MKKITLLTLLLLISVLTIAQDLIAHYPFNGNSKDVSGNNYNGTVNGPQLTYDRFEKAQSAYLFDGDKDYIQVEPKLPIDGFPLTVSVWIKPSKFSEDGYNYIYVNDKWDHYWGSYKGFCVNLLSTGALVAAYGNTINTSVNSFITNEGSVQLNLWQHIVAKFNGPEDVEIFINNEKKETTETDPGNDEIGFSSTFDRIGYAYDGLNRHSFNGAIDDFKIYSSVLSDSEIGVLYHENGWTGSIKDQETSTVPDKDGNVYKTVKIGDQWWMAENLKVTQYPDGTDIPQVLDKEDWDALEDNNIDDAFCYYENDAAISYGALYTWAAAMGGNAKSSSTNPSDVQGVCPNGWHLPSDDEWNEMSFFLNSAGHANKEANVLKSTAGWNSNGNGTDLFGFNALPGGSRNENGPTFADKSERGYWWTSTENTKLESEAYGRCIFYNSALIERKDHYKSHGFSVRCVKDEEQLNLETGTVPDKDGNTYKTVKIGNQWWMAENLNTDIEGSSFYEDKSENGEDFGRLYDWETAVSACPEGWHLPSDEEWKELERTIGMSDDQIELFSQAGNPGAWRGTQAKKLYSGGSTGLDLLFGGYYVPSTYYEIDESGRYWASSEYSGSTAWNRRFGKNEKGIDRRINPKDRKFSVRCLENIHALIEIEIDDSENVFTNDFFYNKSLNFFYIKVKDPSPQLTENVLFEYKDEIIGCPAGFRYLGNNICQFWLDLRDHTYMENISLKIPNTISNDQLKFTFNKSIPEIPITVRNIDQFQSINLFNGKSISASIGANPKFGTQEIALAKLSATSSNGMHLQIERDSLGNDLITRSFESGLGIGTSVLGLNLGTKILNVKAGTEGEYSVTGFNGTTLNFTSNDEDDLLYKTAYLLEAFNDGLIELGPLGGVYFRALLGVLGSKNIVSGKYLNNQFHGFTTEGLISTHLSLNGELFSNGTGIDIDIVEIGLAFADENKSIFYDGLNRGYSINHSAEFNKTILKAKINDVLLFQPFLNFENGNDISLNADYNKITGLQKIELSLIGNSNTSVSFYDNRDAIEYKYVVPKYIIDQSISKNGIISDVNNIFTQNQIKPFNISNLDLSSMYTDFFPNHSTYPDVITNYAKRQTFKTNSLGLSFKPSFEITVGIGMGLGMDLTYEESITSLVEEDIIANGKALKLINTEIGYQIKSKSFLMDLINELFEGTTLLIKKDVIALINKTEFAIEEIINIVDDFNTGFISIKGTVNEAVKIIINRVDPSKKIIQKSAFLDPKILNGYISRNVIHLENKSGKLDDEPETTKLYLVSDNFNINLYDENDQVIEEFDPVYLSLAIDQNKMNELDFGDELKPNAKMYYFNYDSLYWVELGVDEHEHPDTVATLISKSGNYAVGIELRPSDDKTAPEILSYFPQQEMSLNKDTMIWAKLYESSTGVGIDFSQTIISIDNKVVDAYWNPVDHIISYEIDRDSTLEAGAHSFTIKAVDYNGNESQVAGTFMYDKETGTVNVNTKTFNIDCYPNPVIDVLNIRIGTNNTSSISLAIYNYLGQMISADIQSAPNNGVVSATWDKTNYNGQLVPNGVYFVRVKQGDAVFVKKVVIK